MVSTSTNSLASTSSGSKCVARHLDLAGGGATSIVTDAEIVFYQRVDGKIMRGDLDTGATIELASTTGEGVLALDGGQLYFADGPTIRRVPEMGGPTEDVASVGTGSVFFFAIGESGLYAFDGGATLGFHDLFRFDASGAAVLAKNVGLPFGLAADEVGAVYVDQEPFDGPDGSVTSVDPAGAAVLLTHAAHSPRVIVQRDGYDAWADETDAASTLHGGIMRVPKSGGAIEKVFAFDGVSPVWIATDGVVWAVTALGVPNTGDAASRVLIGIYPIANGSATIASIDSSDAFFTAVAMTPTRIVWTVQQGTNASSIAVDSVWSFCKADLPI